MLSNKISTENKVNRKEITAYEVKRFLSSLPEVKISQIVLFQDSEGILYQDDEGGDPVNVIIMNDLLQVELSIFTDISDAKARVSLSIDQTFKS